MTSACWGAQDLGRGVVCGPQGTRLDPLLICILCNHVYSKVCRTLPPAPSPCRPGRGGGTRFQAGARVPATEKQGWPLFLSRKLPCTPPPGRCRGLGLRAVPQLWLCWGQDTSAGCKSPCTKPAPLQAPPGSHPPPPPQILLPPHVQVEVTFPRGSPELPAANALP